MTKGICLLGLMLTLGCRHAPPPRESLPPEPAVSFALNGAAITPWAVPLHGTPECPETGDLVLVGEVIMTVGPERMQRFLRSSEEGIRVMLDTGMAPPRVVGVRVTREGESIRSRVINPMEGMKEDEIRALRGVWLEEWDASIEKQIGHMDGENCCVTIGWDLAQRHPEVTRSLPRSLRHLQYEPDRPGVQDRESSDSRPKVDAAEIAAFTRLESLCVKGVEVEHVESLGTLAELQSLEIQLDWSTDDPSFLAGLTRLRNLDLAGKSLWSISPLSRMHQLAFLSAELNLGIEAEASLPLLREVRVDKYADANRVARLLRSCPGRKVIKTMQEALLHAVGPATRVRVRSGGT